MPNPTKVPGCPDFPDAWTLPNGAQRWFAEAHASNYTHEGSMWYGGPKEIRAFVLHTPEEPPDDGINSAGWWFQQPQANASTSWGITTDGDLWQYVRLTDFAWGQGAHGANVQLPRPVWAPDGKYNRYAEGVEIEGRAATLGRTLVVGGPQWDTLVELIARRSIAGQYIADRAHVVGHSELAKNRRDPGAGLDFAALLQDVTERRFELTVTPPPIVEPEPDPPPETQLQHHHPWKSFRRTGPAVWD